MIVRRCAKGFEIVLHKNNRPDMIKTIQMINGETTTITYPGASADYFVWVQGKIVKKTNSFKVAEEAFVAECAKVHDGGNGRIDFVKHKIVNNQVVSR